MDTDKNSALLTALASYDLPSRPSESTSLPLQGSSGQRSSIAFGVERVSERECFSDRECFRRGNAFGGPGFSPATKPLGWTGFSR